MSYCGFYDSSLQWPLENARSCLIMQPVGLHVHMCSLMLTVLPGKRLANPSFHLLSILMESFLCFICPGACVWEGSKQRSCNLGSFHSLNSCLNGIFTAWPWVVNIFFFYCETVSYLTCRVPVSKTALRVSRAALCVWETVCS